jgi:T-complex protein 1 subunit gamma
MDESTVVRGCILNKDVTHTKMRRRIEGARILLLDCPLEYKKLENQAAMEFANEEDFTKALKLEEEYIKKMCDDILKYKPDLVITEKGLSDLAQHYLVRANVTALRRLRKTDNNRIARATGATIVSRPDEIKVCVVDLIHILSLSLSLCAACVPRSLVYVCIQESDIGKCGLFEIRKIGDEYFSFIEQCENPAACTILLRGATKDVLSEVDRNLQDAMNVAKNVILEPRLLPGGGSTEMSIAYALMEKSKSIEGVQQWPYHSLATAFEVIPRTLAQNCGAKTVRVLTELRVCC